MRYRALGVIVAVALVGACSNDGEETPPTATSLAADDVAPAIAAVESARDGPQRFTEINANADGVTLFVAIDDETEVAYFYADGALAAPGAPAPASAPPFSLDGVARKVAPELVGQTRERFPGATVTTLALVTVPQAGLVWALKSRSPQGGVLNVFYSPPGELISVAPEPGS